MAKINIGRLLDELGSELYYSTNMTLVQNGPHGMKEETMKDLARFLNACKFERKAPRCSFVKMPETTLSWNCWNSGGGCMIWSYDFQHSSGKTYSIQVSDELLTVVDLPTDEYWDLAAGEDMAPHDLVSHWFTKPGEGNVTVSHTVCPYTGSELAGMIERDVENILANW